MADYLMDTDWAIDALGGHPRSTGLLHRLPPSTVGVSIITIGEIYGGAFGSPNPQARLAKSRAFLEEYPVITLTDNIMEQFAELRFMLRRRGIPLSNFDLLIAATALRYDLTLLTHNRRHFNRIPDLKLYQPDGG